MPGYEGHKNHNIHLTTGEAARASPRGGLTIAPKSESVFHCKLRSGFEVVSKGMNWGHVSEGVTCRIGAFVEIFGHPFNWWPFQGSPKHTSNLLGSYFRKHTNMGNKMLQSPRRDVSNLGSWGVEPWPPKWSMLLFLARPLVSIACRLAMICNGESS